MNKIILERKEYMHCLLYSKLHNQGYEDYDMMLTVT